MTRRVLAGGEFEDGANLFEGGGIILTMVAGGDADFFPSIPFLMSIDVNIVTVAEDDELKGRKETQKTFADEGLERTEKPLTIAFVTTSGQEETDIIAKSFFTIAVIVSNGSFADEGRDETDWVTVELPCIARTWL